MEAQGKPVDCLTVADHISPAMKDKSGGIAYISELSDRIPTTQNIEYYDRIVVEKSKLRSLITASYETLEDAFDEDIGDAGVDGLLDKAENRVTKIKEERGLKKSERPAPLVRETFRRLEKVMSGEYKGGHSTGFDELDGMLGGLQGNKLIIVAGRPAMGKTSFSLQVAGAVASAGQNTLIVQIEMTNQEVVDRVISQLARVPSGCFDGREHVRDEYLASLYEAAEKVCSLPLFFYSSPHITPADLRSEARRIKAKEGGLGLIVVDYLQIMTPDDKGGRVENKATEIGDISGALKAIAHELDIPMIALAQLNRACDKRPDKRPIVADLRDSGKLEQDADIVMLLYRDEVYNEDTDEKGVAEVIIGKNRNGGTGTVRLGFDKPCMRFSNLPRY